MHNFVGRGFEDVRDPSFDKSFVKVASALMGDRIVARPSLNGDSIANNKTVVTRPARSKKFHMGVACFKVNCNLLDCG